LEDKTHHMMLFLASFLALYFEVLIIRYLSTEIRVFAYLKNLPLIASFLGIGLGMILGYVPKALRRAFPIFNAALFLMITYAGPLHLTHIAFSSADYFVWGDWPTMGWTLLVMGRYFGAVIGTIALVVGFFMVLGGLVGEYLAPLPPLLGYGINLAGSLVGIAVFTLLSSLRQPPIVTLVLGFLALLPFFFRDPMALVMFAIILCVNAAPHPNTFWSPYYRVDLIEAHPPLGWSHPAAYFLSVNHDYHQKPVDLSLEFLARYPFAEPNRSARPTYELPYQLVRNPGEVLIVGAGTGNDVASALRHGATHIDAVEIDPVILQLGKRYHPEHPYDSPRVTVYVDDARAFFRKTKHKYDLIIFGYLDSHTMLSSFSSIRLDNYVYTVESFREARGLLREGGSVVLAFGSGRFFVTERMFATLSRAFGTPPRAYFTGYDSAGVVFVEGAARRAELAGDYSEMTTGLLSKQQTTLAATDRWPFVYLASRTIPQSILWVLLVFLAGSAVLVDRMIGVPSLARPEFMHLFLLGAGFLLLETKAVTEVALLFGSTWVVNAVVIGAFLTMALLANAIIVYRPISSRAGYTGLFVFAAISTAFPYSAMSALATPAKVVASGVVIGLPVFFSGLVFSRGFRDVRSPAQGLGVNLLGAVIGGVLENAVMVTGTPILGILAILLYGFSAVFARRAGALNSARLHGQVEGRSEFQPL
jgi:spermine/spermidine synthase